MMDRIAADKQAENEFRIKLAGFEVEGGSSEQGSVDAGFGDDPIWRAHQRALARAASRDAANRQN